MSEEGVTKAGHTSVMMNWGFRQKCSARRSWPPLHHPLKQPLDLAAPLLWCHPLSISTGSTSNSDSAANAACG